MAFEELIRVTCDGEHSDTEPRRLSFPEVEGEPPSDIAAMFESHRQAIKAAEAAGWFIASKHTLCAGCYHRWVEWQQRKDAAEG